MSPICTPPYARRSWSSPPPSVLAARWPSTCPLPRSCARGRSRWSTTKTGSFRSTTVSSTAMSPCGASPSTHTPRRRASCQSSTRTIRPEVSVNIYRHSLSFIRRDRPTVILTLLPLSIAPSATPGTRYTVPLERITLPQARTYGPSFGEDEEAGQALAGEETYGEEYGEFDLGLQDELPPLDDRELDLTAARRVRMSELSSVGRGRMTSLGVGASSSDIAAGRFEEYDDLPPLEDMPEFLPERR